MSIDSMVRETLRSHADEAPDGVGLLNAVRRRSGRRRRRRAVALAGGLALATALGVVSVPVAHRLVIDSFVEPAAVVELVPPDYELPAFPFTPGWTPPGMGEPSTSFGDTGMAMVYPRLHPGEPLSVSVSRTAQPYKEKLGATTEQTITVRSRPATLLRVDNRPEKPIALTWQEPDGQWVTVFGSYPLDVDDVRRFAEELVARPVPMRPPFTFDLVPRGAVLIAGGSWYMQLGAFGADPATLSGAMTVELRADERHPGAIRVAVGGLDAEVVEERSDGRLHVQLYVHLDGGRMLVVGSSGTLGMLRDTTLQFAAGIHVTPDARPNW